MGRQPITAPADITLSEAIRAVVTDSDQLDRQSADAAVEVLFTLGPLDAARKARVLLLVAGYFGLDLTAPPG